LTAFLRDIGQLAVLAIGLVIVNAHEVQPMNGIGWLVLLLAVIGVPFCAWARLTAGGREYTRRREQQLQGAYAIYVRITQRWSILVMAPAFVVCWFMRSINDFVWVWLATMLVFYFYAVMMHRAEKRTLA
jgi:hypothetical protein